MLLNDDKVRASTGDVVIQRGMNRACSNRGTETCIVAFVLIDTVSRWDATDGYRGGVPDR